MFTPARDRELLWGTGQVSPTSHPSRPAPKLGAQQRPSEARPITLPASGAPRVPRRRGLHLGRGRAPDGCTRKGVFLASWPPQCQL